MGGAAPISLSITSKEFEWMAYRRLARKMHWRTCPNCTRAVDKAFGKDGIAQCTNCLTRFNWLEAPLLLPVSSVGALLQEVRWEYDEARRDAPDSLIQWTEVGNLYWAATTRPTRTRGATVKLAVYRSIIVVPLVVALPMLTLR